MAFVGTGAQKGRSGCRCPSYESGRKFLRILSACHLWAFALPRLFTYRPLSTAHRGAEVRIIAFITESSPVQRILTQIGEPVEPPSDWETMAQLQPKYVLDLGLH